MTMKYILSSGPKSFGSIINGPDNVVFVECSGYNNNNNKSNNNNNVYNKKKSALGKPSKLNICCFLKSSMNTFCTSNLSKLLLFFFQIQFQIYLCHSNNFTVNKNEAFLTNASHLTKGRLAIPCSCIFVKFGDCLSLQFY